MKEIKEVNEDEIPTVKDGQTLRFEDVRDKFQQKRIKEVENMR